MMAILKTLSLYFLLLMTLASMATAANTHADDVVKISPTVVEKITPASDLVNNNFSQKNASQYISSQNIAPQNIESVATSKTAIIKTLAGLGITLIIILGLSYLAKKIGLQNLHNNQHMRIVSSLPLGQKERAVLIEVNNQTLLIGVSQGNVNLLKTIQENSSDFDHTSGSHKADYLHTNTPQNPDKKIHQNVDHINNKNNTNINNHSFKHILTEQSQISTISAANIIAFSKNIKRFMSRK